MKFFVSYRDPIIPYYQTFRYMLLIYSNGIKRTNIITISVKMHGKIFQMKEQRENVIHLDHIKSDVMEIIIDYLYSGKLSVDCENALELWKAADYLMIDSKETYKRVFFQL